MTLTLNTTILGLFAATALLAADVNPNSSTPKDTAAQLLAEAKNARTVSTELAKQLKAKNADLSKVSEHVTSVEKSTAAINQLVAALESNREQLNDRQRNELNNTRQLADLLQVFVTNKSGMVADGTNASERERVRANAISAAKRAELIELSVKRMGM